MTIAAYIRISDPGQNITSQRVAIETWLVNHGHTPDAVRWFEDKHTGRTTNRPAFMGLKRAIFMGEIKTVVFWKFDRIARSLKDGINTLHDWCGRGLRVVCITQELDLSGTMGQMIASLLFGLAQIGLENNKEDQRRGIEAAKKRGVYTGRKAGTFKGNPKRAKELKAQGFKTSEIATALGVSKQTVWRYLKAG